MEHVRRVIRSLRREHLLRDGTRLTDAELLDRFVAERDEAAFEALVQLHGPIVLGICRRILRHAQDAEDAFQATFLIFARKAPTIARGDRIANWLFGVARRTSLKSRSRKARRTEVVQPVTEIRDSSADASTLDTELAEWLDHEIGRLPEKYRLAILLCDLEGRPQEEAARQLGCLPGTLSVRLSRARAKLASQLARHGYALTAAACATLLEGCVRSGPVPASMASGTSHLCLHSHPAGSVSSPVSSLAEGVLRSMFINKTITVAMAVALIAVLGLGLGGTYYRMQAGEPARLAQANPEKRNEFGIAKNDEPDMQSERELLDVARLGYEAALAEYEAGTTSLEDLLRWSKRWLDAEQAFELRREARVRSAETHLARMQWLEREVKSRADIGAKGGGARDYEAARFHRIEAELLLRKAKR